MSHLQIGDSYHVPGMGPGVILGFHGRFEGQREWLYLLVGFTPTLRALVPLREGVVLQ